MFFYCKIKNFFVIRGYDEEEHRKELLQHLHDLDKPIPDDCFSSMLSDDNKKIFRDRVTGSIGKINPDLDLLSWLQKKCDELSKSIKKEEDTALSSKTSLKQHMELPVVQDIDKEIEGLKQQYVEKYDAIKNYKKQIGSEQPVVDKNDVEQMKKELNTLQQEENKRLDEVEAHKKQMFKNCAEAQENYDIECQNKADKESKKADCEKRIADLKGTEIIENTYDFEPLSLFCAFKSTTCRTLQFPRMVGGGGFNVFSKTMYAIFRFFAKKNSIAALNKLFDMQENEYEDVDRITEIVISSVVDNEDELVTTIEGNENCLE